MSKAKKEKSEVVHIVKQLRPFLQDMVVEDENHLLEEVDVLLTAAGHDEEVDMRLTNLLSKNPKARSWMKSALFVEGERFEPQPGFTPVPATRYVCPVLECQFGYIPFKIGRPIPPCPVHNRALVPIKDKEKT